MSVNNLNMAVRRRRRLSDDGMILSDETQLSDIVHDEKQFSLLKYNNKFNDSLNRTFSFSIQSKLSELH